MQRSSVGLSIILLATLVLGLAACSGDDDEALVADTEGTVADDDETTSGGDGTTTTAGADGTTTTARGDGTTTTARGDGTTTTTASLTPPELEEPVNDRGAVALTGQQVEVAAGDFFFDPTFVRVQPGSEFTAMVVNEGNVPHTFTNEDLGFDVVLDPGQRQEVEVAIPADADDEIVYVCRFHAAQGMRGAFFFPG